MISLLKYFGWRTFGILYEDGYEKVAKSLQTEAKANSTFNVTIYKELDNWHDCCKMNSSCCVVSFWHNLLEETKLLTRSKYNAIKRVYSYNLFSFAMERV